MKRWRDAHVESYNAARQAMINLGYSSVEDDEFPALTTQDLTMKYTEQPHALGDGSISMALIWRAGGRRKTHVAAGDVETPAGIFLCVGNALLHQEKVKFLNLS